MPSPQDIDVPFQLLERSELFSYLRDLIQQAYRPSIKDAVDEYGLVIVGGQSLALWARQYLIDELTGEDVGFVTSDDLDFYGKYAAIEYCEDVLKVPFRRATMDDNSPNIAVGVVEWRPDQQLVIDILGSVAGVEEKEIFKNLAVIDLDDVPVAVIDPVTCLKSRLFNLFAPWQGDRNRESVRVAIAIRASNCYICELLVYEGYRAAAHQIRRIKALALSRLGKRVFVEYGVDLLHAIPMDSAIFPADYVTKELPGMVQQVSDVRRRKIVQYERFGGVIHASHYPAPAAAVTDLR